MTEIPIGDFLDRLQAFFPDRLSEPQREGISRLLTDFVMAQMPPAPASAPPRKVQGTRPLVSIADEAVDVQTRCVRCREGVKHRVHINAEDDEPVETLTGDPKTDAKKLQSRLVEMTANIDMSQFEEIKQQIHEMAQKINHSSMQEMQKNFLASLEAQRVQAEHEEEQRKLWDEIHERTAALASGVDYLSLMKRSNGPTKRCLLGDPHESHAWISNSNSSHICPGVKEIVASSDQGSTGLSAAAKLPYILVNSEPVPGTFKGINANPVSVPELTMDELRKAMWKSERQSFWPELAEEAEKISLKRTGPTLRNTDGVPSVEYPGFEEGGLPPIGSVWKVNSKYHNLFGDHGDHHVVDMIRTPSYTNHKDSVIVFASDAGEIRVSLRHLWQCFDFVRLENSDGS